MTSGSNKHRDPAMRCAHCGSVAKIRNSEALTPLIRQIRYRCDNDACGHIFIAHLEQVRTVVPSAQPNPTVSLPFFGNVRKGAPKPANEDSRMPANDDTTPAATAAPGDTLST